MKKPLLFLAFVLSFTLANAQRVGSTPEYIRAITSEWKGERFADGRPRVSDNILARLKNIGIEDAWGVLRNKGYQNQYEGNWIIINPDSAMTGRVVTAQYMPLRPDFQSQIREQGISEKRSSKRSYQFVANRCTC